MAMAALPVSFEISRPIRNQETDFATAVRGRTVASPGRSAAWLRRIVSAAAILAFVALMILGGRTALSQESVLYSFPSPGCYPSFDDAPVLDKSGNLYGTCVGAQPAGGTIYELSPNGTGGWTAQTIYTFANNGVNSTGSQPNGLVFDANKVNLYGTTNFGGAYNLGTVFELSPGTGGWTETVLYSFGTAGMFDASLPLSGVILDSAGNLYGTTSAGGANYATGTVYELSPGTPWKETILHSFADVDTGGDAITSRLVFDGQGNLYGTSPTGGGASFGAVYKLSPASGGTWTETVLYTFGTNNPSTDALTPVGALVFDGSGNLYGVTSSGGTGSEGAVFELSPNSNNIWTEKVLYSFADNGTDGYTPVGGITIDSKGNLYGTASVGGTHSGTFGSSGYGTIYELSPGTPWTETVLYDFNYAASDSDSYEPRSNMLFDVEGNLYGSALGGSFAGGSVFEFTAAAITTRTPQFSPAPGSYTTTQTVTISDQSPAATIYYTTDGNTPTTSSPVYSSPLTVSSIETIKAIATSSGLLTSAVGVGDYVVAPAAATPVISASTNVYTAPLSVTITDASPGTSIYYTLDGSTPTTSSTLYTGAITVLSSEFINAIASGGDFSNSAEASSYVIISNPIAAAPIFSPPAGTYATAQMVTLADSTPSASIYYTTDGSTPTAASTLYSGAIAVSATETIKAIAVAASYSNSAVASATYTIGTSPVATPTFSPAAGTYTSVQSVTIGDSTSGATIYYTTNGTTPTTSSTKYTGAITVSSTEVIEAIAVASGHANSAVGSASYTIDIPVTATPIISPSGGSFTSAQSVTITDATAGAAIYFTTNGTTPTSSSTLYSGALAVSTSETVKAIAVAAGDLNSSVASATYTITSPYGAQIGNIYNLNSASICSGSGVSAPPVFDNNGNLFGTCNGTSGAGEAFEITPNMDGSWTGTIIYSTGANIGNPSGGLLFDSTKTNLFGVEATSGANGLGSVYELSPAGGGTWTLTTLYNFQHGTDGSAPEGNLAMDASGNLYGTTASGGANGVGTVFELVNTAGVWTEKILYSFGASSTDASSPTYGVLFDTAGNLYGVTNRGGNASNYGALFKLTPQPGGSWTESVLHTFGQAGTSDGFHPVGALIMDSTGNLYGATQYGLNGGYGIVYELSPAAGGVWNETILHTFAENGTDGATPQSGLTLDASGNLYGTTSQGGASLHSGTIYKVVPSAGGSEESVLFSFEASGDNIGSYPIVGLTRDSSGNFYGATTTGGVLGGGSIFKFTPGPIPAAPTFSVAAGNYATTQSVELADSVPTALIYYTTNGSEPGANSTLYTGAITVSANETINAIALAPGYASSYVSSAAYTIGTPVAATPTFSPAAGAYTSSQSVTISDSTAGAAIYYTTNGTTPTTSSTKYTGAITVAASETIEAIAVASGYSNSAVATAAYTINIPVAATPTFSPVAGSYTSAQSVTISDTTAGAVIYYTTDGSTPSASSTKYTSAISVASTETIEAIAIASGYTNSAVASAAYTINIPSAATPAFSPSAGTYTSAQSVTISDATAGSTIYYTTNGTTPSTSSTKYTGAITVSATETLEAIAIASGYSNSTVATATYTITPPAATPTFSPAAGTYTSAQSVTISDTTAGATIYYTTDGSTPTTASTKYTGAISVSSTETIKAIATASGFTTSAVASTAYTINLSATATPTFSPAAGTYTSTQSVTISDATAGATIYYTTDGSTPTTSSTVYTGAISVSSTETIKAIATASGFTNSAVGSAAYTITPPAATPSFSPIAGTYTSVQSVTISDTTAGATIYYTTDGSTPTTASTKYTAAISVGSTETIKAIATASGFSTSAIGSAAFTINIPVAATPTFSPAAGTYSSAQTVTISDATGGATIYYTTNGTTPTSASTKYTGSITVSSTETLEAIAIASGYTNSAVATATYTITPQAATPVFSVSAGTYSAKQTVTITDSTAGATIYYTTNGTTPSASSTKYTGAITVSSTETLEAIAVASGYSNSSVATAAYVINIPVVATPTFSPAAGTYTSAQNVTISDSTAGATIYYTTDGSTPSATSTKYTSAIAVSSNETIQAIAIASGYTNSAIASATYTITPPAATPTFSLAGGTYTSAQSVSLSDATAGASIYYTVDGSTPTTSSTKYTAAISVGATETIEAIAVASGYSSSAVASAVYTINIPVAATPVFSPGAGTYTAAQSVTITDSTAGASIYYTTDGSTPTASSTKYTAAISVGSTETIKAIAIASGYTNSAVASAAYTINIPVASTPSFSPAAGTYTSVQSVTISDSTSGATIYYTTDGSTPSASSTKYTTAINVGVTETIQAIAIASGYTNSAVASATYTINIPVAATPVFSPAAGTYTSLQSVTITDSTAGATIYYTTDGSMPSASSTQYTAAISVGATETIQAIAIATGYTNSTVASAAYTINIPPPTFTVSVSESSLTIPAGSSGTVTISVASMNGFSGPTTFGCSGLPAGATCSFSPSSITPAAGATATTTLTVTAPSTAALENAPMFPGKLPGGLTLAAALCLFGLRKRRRQLTMFVLFVALIGTTALVGCGGSSKPKATTSTVTVTATSGSIQQTIPLTITIQ